MAWDASFAALAPGERLMAVTYQELKAALQERAGWVGDTTHHDEAAALSDITAGDSTTNDARLKPFINGARSIIEGILGAFRRADSFSAGVYAVWTKALLLQHIYDSHGGEDSGVLRTGTGPYTYNWLKLPTRAGGPTSGDVTTGMTVYHEHPLAIYLALDHLRCIQLQPLSSDPPNQGSELAKDASSYSSLQAAWDTMLAATPGETDGYTQSTLIIYNSVSPWHCRTQRSNQKFEWEHTPLAGHYPTGYDSARMALYARSTYSNYRDFLVDFGLAGKSTWSGGSNVLATILAANDTWYDNELTGTGGLPTGSGSSMWAQWRLKDDAAATVPWPINTNYGLQFGESNVGSYFGPIVLKPTTSYGT